MNQNHTAEQTASRTLDLFPVPLLSVNKQMRLREIRNEPETRRWSYTDHEIPENEHRRWLAGLADSDRHIVFGVLNGDGTVIGATSVSGIDRWNRRADWSFYLTNNVRGSGVGAVLEYRFVDFVFGVLEMEKLTCEVIEGNTEVISLHARFGFQEEGFRRAHIRKDGRRVSVHEFGLLKEEWLSHRERLQRKFGTVLDQFSVTIHES